MGMDRLTRMAAQTDARGRVTLTISITAADAEYLGGTVAESFWRQDRFQLLGTLHACQPEEIRWLGIGSMTWCGCSAEWLVLQAYEIACGFEAYLLIDRDPVCDRYVVVSSRPFPAAASEQTP